MQAEQRTEDDSSPGLQALAVLLKQHELVDERMLFALLGCSRAVAGVVHAEFRGRLNISMLDKQQEDAEQQPGRHAESYRLWLAKHAPLLHTLSLTLSGPADEAAVAAGLDAAAAAAVSATADLAPAGEAAEATAPALPLKSLHCWSPISGELLAAVARSSSPTSLLLTLEGGRKAKKAKRPALSAALASLTSLQQLQLRPAGAAPAYVSQLGGALACLPGLRVLLLHTGVLLQPADVRTLPAGSLRVLSLSSRTGKGGRLAVVDVEDMMMDHEYQPDPSQWEEQVAELQALDLRRLSSLTRLDIHSLTSRDKLPPSLQELRLTTPHSFEPVLQCTSLQSLRIKDDECLTPWHELPEVSAALKGLHSVAVELGNPFGASYGGGEFMPWPTWDLHHIGNTLAGVKQLKQLVVKDFYLLPSFVKGLSRYSQLTHLGLVDCVPIQHKNDDLTWDCVDWTKAQAAKLLKAFGAALKQLQQLRHLELLLKLGEMQSHDSKDRGWSVGDAELQPLVQAAEGLPNLEGVYITGDRSGPALVKRMPCDVAAFQAAEFRSAVWQLR